MLTNDAIFERTDRSGEFGFSNVLQIISANSISTQLFFTRGLELKIKITITFLYETEF